MPNIATYTRDTAAASKDTAAASKQTSAAARRTAIAVEQLVSVTEETVRESAESAASSSRSAKWSVGVSATALITALGSLVYAYFDFKGDAEWQSQQIELLSQIRDSQARSQLDIRDNTDWQSQQIELLSQIRDSQAQLSATQFKIVPASSTLPIVADNDVSKATIDARKADRMLTDDYVNTCSLLSPPLRIEFESGYLTTRMCRQ